MKCFVLWILSCLIQLVPVTQFETEAMCGQGCVYGIFDDIVMESCVWVLHLMTIGFNLDVWV